MNDVDYEKVKEEVDSLFDSDIRILPFLAYLENRVDEIIKNNAEETKNVFWLYLYLLYRKRKIKGILKQSRFIKVFENYVGKLPERAFELLEKIDPESVIKIYEKFYSVIESIDNRENDKCKVVNVYFDILEQYKNKINEEIIKAERIRVKNSEEGERRIREIYCVLMILLYQLITKFYVDREKMKQCFSEKDDLIKDDLINVNCSELLGIRSHSVLDNLKIKGDCFHEVIRQCLISLYLKEEENIKSQIDRLYKILPTGEPVVICSNIKNLYDSLISQIKKFPRNNSNSKFSKYYWGIYLHILKIFKCLYCPYE